MTNWKYKLELEGKLLRQLIDKEETIENIIAIYNQLVVCLKVLKKKLSKTDRGILEYDIDSMIDDLECASPDIDDDFDYQEEEENLNYYLRDFYDFCDSVGVWIGV